MAGPHGYEEYLTVLADTEHEEHENMLQWRGPFDPETFSPAQVNQGLQKKFRSRKAGEISEPSLRTAPAQLIPEILRPLRTLAERTPRTADHGGMELAPKLRQELRLIFIKWRIES